MESHGCRDDQWAIKGLIFRSFSNFYTSANLIILMSMICDVVSLHDSKTDHKNIIMHSFAEHIFF
jgi:hypothetical protein